MSSHGIYRGKVYPFISGSTLSFTPSSEKPERSGDDEFYAARLSFGLFSGFTFFLGFFRSASMASIVLC